MKSKIIWRIANTSGSACRWRRGGCIWLISCCQLFRVNTSLVNQPLLPCVNRLQYLMAGRRVWALTHGFHVNTTRDLGSFNCPIRFENVFMISRDRNGALWRVTALEESVTSQVYRLSPKQTEACWLLSLSMTCLFNLLKVRVALKIRISKNL